MTSTLVNQWPPVLYERPIHAGSMQNGGDYLASRHALLDQYARRWLLALHNQNINLFSSSLFETCDDLVHMTVKMDLRNLNHNKSVLEVSYHSFPVISSVLIASQRSEQCEQALHHILRLSQARVLFSATDTIYLRWLEFVDSYGTVDEVRNQLA